MKGFSLFLSLNNLLYLLVSFENILRIIKIHQWPTIFYLWARKYPGSCKVPWKIFPLFWLFWEETLVWEKHRAKCVQINPEIDKMQNTKSQEISISRMYEVFFFFIFTLFYFLVVFVIHWHEKAMDIHVFSILISPATSLSTQSLWVFPVHQVRALVSCIQPGLVICFTLVNIHVSMLFSQNIPPSPSPTESKSLFYTSVSLFLFCI